VVVDGGRLGAHLKELGILCTPYVAKDFEELHKLVTSPLSSDHGGESVDMLR
jgi:TRAP-type C4-dicarboxylate transport system substrate-binding protein